MCKTAEIYIDDKRIVCRVGQTLGECLSLDIPCGGHGKCGKCKIRAFGAISPISEIEKSKLSKSEIEDGVRLACRTLVLGECRVYTSAAQSSIKEKIITDGSKEDIEVSEKLVGYGVSVDIGTTTLAARLYSENGEMLAKSARVNPQGSFGADVVSRIESAINGKSRELQELVLFSVDEMICEMANDASIDAKEIKNLVITGNTAMLQLLTGTPADNLARAPFELTRPFNETVRAGDIGLSSVHLDAEIYLPPSISAFVGADTVCALISSELCKTDKTALLVDVGTNGEMCLWHENSLYVTSTAAGPCFEGVGISCGMRAKTGAIDRAWVENGKISVHTVENAPAIGVCGSGLVDIIASMLDTGRLGEMGNVENMRCEISEGVFIEQSDITMVQMAKSAICAGMKTVMETADVYFADKTIIAGGFGSSLDIKNAVRIGLFPENTGEAYSAGNAALDGASILLFDKNREKRCAEIVNKAKVVPLATSDVFYDHYVSSMAF